MSRERTWVCTMDDFSRLAGQFKIDAGSLHGKTWQAGKEKTLRKHNLMVTLRLLTMVGEQSWESNWEMGNIGLVRALCELQDIC